MTRIVTEQTAWRGSVAPSRVREYVLSRDGYACRYCGATGDGVILELDHIVPIRLLGHNTCTNTATACRQCNRDKGGHTVACWQDGKPCIKTISFPRYSKTACK